MPPKDNRFKLDESKPLNPYLLKLIKEQANGNLSEFGRLVGLNKGIISLALNNKPVSIQAMIKIARPFGMDSREIF